MFRNLIARTVFSFLTIPALFGAQRFDSMIRNDFFAGFAGDNAALAKAMKSSEEVIAANPTDCAEALAWHGSGLLVQSGAKFQQGDYKTGTELWEQGNIEMERAGKMAPDNIGVLVPRAATWFAASRNMPVERQKPILRKAVADYEHVYAIQKDYFDTLHIHNKSELLFGLADGYARLDEKEKARETFEKLAALGQKSGHLAQAKAYLDSGTYTVTGAGCASCHTGK